jgi:hypothetical protein
LRECRTTKNQNDQGETHSCSIPILALKVRLDFRGTALASINLH